MKKKHIENEADIDIESKLLAAEMVQSVYDCASRDSPSPHIDAHSIQKEARRLKQSESNETEANDTDGKHMCPECDRCFSSAWNLKEHIERHSDDNPYHCWLCNKS